MPPSLFSHPVVEQPASEALTTPQDSRYGSLFRQPAYTPGLWADDDTELAPAPAPRRPARTPRHHR